MKARCLNYGAATTGINNRATALKIATGLNKLAAALSDPNLQLLTAADFKDGETDNTWVSISVVTEKYGATPEKQFTTNLIIKFITSTTELGDGTET